MQAVDRDIFARLRDGLALPVFVGLAHRSQAMPYAIMYPSESDGYRVFSNHTRIEDRTVQIHVYTTAADAARGFMDSIESVLTDPASSFTIALKAFKVFDNLSLDPDPGPDDGEVWHGVVSVKFSLNRNP